MGEEATVNYLPGKVYRQEERRALLLERLLVLMSVPGVSGFRGRFLGLVDCLSVKHLGFSFVSISLDTCQFIESHLS